VKPTRFGVAGQRHNQLNRRIHSIGDFAKTVLQKNRIDIGCFHERSFLVFVGFLYWCKFKN
jgi:hypothetical protein